MAPENGQRKHLSEMTLEELWQLFPIVLSKHRDEWKEWYGEEKALLTEILPPDVRITHIGSTAIEGIWAKPIVDILVEIPQNSDMAAVRDTLLAHGYLCMSEEPGRISCNKGYTETGFAERVFHIHVRFDGDHDEILFRDYMNAHPDAAAEYEALKLGICKQYEHDRDGYTEAKTAFVKKYTQLAKNVEGDGLNRNEEHENTTSKK